MTDNYFKNISVIGAGPMGIGIAQVFMLSKVDNVYLVDISKKALLNAKERLKTYIEKLATNNFFRQNGEAKRIFNKLILSEQLKDPIFESDLITEAIPEDIELKTNLLRNIGDRISKETIIASNTSTFTITELGEASGKPENTIGTHYFLPPFTRSCIEIMKGKKTSDEAFHKILNFCRTIPAQKGSMYVAPLEKDTPGFIANRLLIPGTLYFTLIADKAVEKGIPIEQLDADTRDITNVGPFELCDYLGLDTAYKSLKSFEKRVSVDFTPRKLLTYLVSKGYYGKKTGRGFYEYRENGKPLIDKTKKSGLLDPELMLAIQLNEGCKLLEEKIVLNYSIIENVMKIGVGTQGPFIPGKHNYEKWSELLSDFSIENDINYFKPCRLMTSGKFIEMRN
ncbi:MAG: 3-hydroxyacyl-CoA dehydrogenase family protein [Candidatus Lokiarchaeota archaeon]|nr:3-hydroxyacyl-CoA dehydrogenase family protein [Candidatus Lokiarchaeota archaeon]